MIKYTIDERGIKCPLWMTVSSNLVHYNLDFRFKKRYMLSELQQILDMFDQDSTEFLLDINRLTIVTNTPFTEEIQKEYLIALKEYEINVALFELELEKEKLKQMREKK